MAIQKPRRRSRNPRSSRLRNPGQLRRDERYRQNPSLKGVKIGRRYGVKFASRLTPKDMLALSFGVPKDVFDAFPKGETYSQAGPVLPASEALDPPWPNRAARDFDGGTFRLATVYEWPISKSMSGGVMTIKPGAMRNLHWNVNANEWHYYLRGKGQVALFGSGGRGKVAEFKPGDVAYIPQGFGHAIKNVGDEDLEIVQTWDNGKFEEIDLTKWVQSSPRYLLANNFAGVPETTITRLKQA